MQRLSQNLLEDMLQRMKSRLHGAFGERLQGVILYGSEARHEAAADSDIDLLVTFRPEVHLGWDFFELQKEIEEVLGCEVDLLTRRSVEQDENAIRRRSILESTCEIYAA